VHRPDIFDHFLYLSMKRLFTFLALISATISMAQSDSLPSHVFNLAGLKTVKDSSRNRIQFMDGSTTSLSNFEVHLTILEPGKSAHPAHTHEATEELLIIKEGKLQVTIAGRKKILGAGDVAISLPGDEHGATNVGDTKTAYYVLKYTGKNQLDKDRGAQAGGSILTALKEVPVQKTDKGYRRQVIDRSTAIFRRFEMHTTALNKGEISHPPHTHRQEEIILMLKGEIEMQLNDRFFKAVPGDLVFISSLTPHALKNLTNGQCEYFAFQWE
jgi:(S)-ureidoglycine aminohydrolase